MTHVRVNQSTFSDDKWHCYNSALKKLYKAKDDDKKFSNYEDFWKLHKEHFFDHIHDTTMFLPWHRYFIYRFEKKLRAEDSSLVVPYWDIVAQPKVPKKIDNPGLFDLGVIRILHPERLPKASDRDEVMRKATYPEFAAAMDEFHGRGHNAFSGASAMSGKRSAKDPVFWLYHAYIDKLWNDWMDDHPGAMDAYRDEEIHGFEGKTFGDVLNTEDLDYRYA